MRKTMNVGKGSAHLAALVVTGLAALLFAAGCGDTVLLQGEACTAQPGNDGVLVVDCPGVDPIVVRDGVDAQPCTIEDQGDGTRRVRCGENSFVVHDGDPGATGRPGDPGRTGTPGVTGVAGVTGPGGAPCAVADNGDGTWTLQCPDSDPVVVADAAGCTVEALPESEEEDFEMRCPDGSSVRWSAGTEGPRGEPGASCTITDNGDETWTFQCPGDDPVTLRNGLDGDSCSLTDLGEGEYELDCPGSDPVVVRDGERGADGDPGASCTVEPLGEGEYELTCPGSDPVVVRDGARGADGDPGASCTLQTLEAGVHEITCPGSAPVIIRDGADGEDGEDGAPGGNCTVTPVANGHILSCPGQSPALIRNGEDGETCSVVDNGNDTYTLTCTGSAPITFERGTPGSGGGGDAVPCGLRPGAVCMGQDLEEFYLKGLDLSGANFSGSNLRRSVLDDTRIVGTIFYRANLGSSFLRGADAREAVFWEANMGSSDAQMADLRGADLRGTTTRFADFSGADLRGAELGFSEVVTVPDRTGMKLIGVVANGASFHSAELNDADLRDAVLDGADMRNTRLLRTNAQGASMIGANFSGSGNFTAGCCGTAQLWGADLRNADFRDVTTFGTPLNSALTFDGSDLTCAQFEGAAVSTTRWSTGAQPVTCPDGTVAADCSDHLELPAFCPLDL